jgi:NitT/TauT family transport system substrate-binding protein
MAADEGKKLLAVGGLASRMNIDCAMNKKIAEGLGITDATPFDQKLKAMKGLTVAGTRPGAFTYLMLVAYGKRAGLVPQQDFKLIGVGGPSSMLPALENEQIAIGCTGSPFAELAVSRGKSIMFANNSAGMDPNFDDFLFEMVYARPDYAAANAQIVRGFLHALFTSVNAFLAAPPEELLPPARELFPGVADPLLIEIIGKTKATLNKSGFVSKESVQKAADFLLSTGAIKNAPPPYEQIVDNQYLPKP